MQFEQFNREMQKNEAILLQINKDMLKSDQIFIQKQQEIRQE